MKAEWLTLAEMEKTIATGEYRDHNGHLTGISDHLAKQIALRVASESKAKAERLKDDPGT